MRVVRNDQNLVGKKGEGEERHRLGESEEQADKPNAIQDMGKGTLGISQKAEAITSRSVTRALDDASRM
jgi:hypothetical protein